MPNPSLEVRLRVLAAIDVAPGTSIRSRIVHASNQTFVCPSTNHSYRFTWRTVSTWYYRYKKAVSPPWTTRLAPIKVNNARYPLLS